jgi:hypothetical protein
MAMGMLSDEERARLIPAELAANPTPVPTQVVSSDEFLPIPQTERQKKVEARMNALADDYGKKNGLPRRRFFQTAAGMATAFVAMNEVYGPLYGASPAEAKSVDLAQARADGLKDQFIMDVHTHFLRDDTRLEGFARGREAVGKAGWNPDLAGKPQTLDDLKYPNWFKEIYLDSDTKVALISGSPSEDPRDWFLTNDMKLDARTRVNQAAGSRRCLSHAIFTPGYPGWMDEVDRAIATLKPDSWKGYAVGDNTNKDLAQHPWRMDDEKLVYPFYEKTVKAGYASVCVHRIFHLPRDALANLALRHRRRCRQGDGDWPNIRFASTTRLSAGRRLPGGTGDSRRRVGPVDQRSPTSREVQRQQRLATSANLRADDIAEPRLCAAVMGSGQGMGAAVVGAGAQRTGAAGRSIAPLGIPRRCAKTPQPSWLTDGPVKRRSSAPTQRACTVATSKALGGVASLPSNGTTTARPRPSIALRLRRSRLTRRQIGVKLASGGEPEGEANDEADYSPAQPAENRDRRVNAGCRAVRGARPGEARAARYHQARHPRDVDQPDLAAAAICRRQGPAAGHAGRACQRVLQAARPRAGIYPHRVRHHDPGPGGQALGHDQHRHLLHRRALQAHVHGALRAGGHQLPCRKGQSAWPEDRRRPRW